MGVPHGISRPRKGKARGCAQASVPHQCATAPLLSSLSRERGEDASRATCGRPADRDTSARARASAKGGRAGSSRRPPPCVKWPNLPTWAAGRDHVSTPPRPLPRQQRLAVPRTNEARGGRGNRLHKQSKRVASRRPRRSLPCTGHVSCCGSETPRAGPWVVGAVAVPQKQAVGGRGGAHWSSGRPHVRARTAQGERGVMGRTARIVREGGRTE